MSRSSSACPLGRQRDLAAAQLEQDPDLLELVGSGRDLFQAVQQGRTVGAVAPLEDLAQCRRPPTWP